MKTQATHNNYDVVIIGGGIVGATLACALADTPLRIALVEDQRAASLSDLDVLRVSAITLASQAIFHNLGVWPAIQAQQVSPLRAMQVWDAQGAGAIHFDAADLGEPELGFIIHNRVMTDALYEHLTQSKQVRIYRPAQLHTLQVDDAGVQVSLSGGKTLHSSLLVGADGVHSRTRELAGISQFGWQYDQRAIVATVKTACPHQETAWQVFLPSGPLAFLPLSNGQCSIVWSCDSARAQTLLALSDGDFMQALSSDFGDHLGAVESVSPRLSFPLALAHAHSYSQERIALIGDAAHRIHPLAGQGVNLGLLDAAVLAEVVLDAQAKGRDVGSAWTLRRYERWRKGDNLALLAVTDAFKRVFGSQAPVSVYLRNAGLHCVDQAGFVKNAIMAHAAGLKGDLPALARTTRA